MSIIKRGLTEMSASVLTVCECQWSRCLNTSWLEGFSVVRGECQCCALFYYTDCHFNSYVGYRRSFTVCTECNFVNKLQKPVFHPRGSLIRKLTCSTVVSAPFSQRALSCALFVWDNKSIANFFKLDCAVN